MISWQGQAENLLRGRLGANNFVALDHGGHADSRGTIFRLSVDSHNFAHSTNKNFRTPSYLSGQRKRNVKFGSRAQVLINREINAAC